MKIQPKARLPSLAVALAACIASASATFQVGDSTLVPGPLGEEPSATAASAALSDPMVTITEPVPGDEPVVAVEQPVSEPVLVKRERVAPAPEHAEPAITITKPRLTEDQRIQADVMDLLARSQNISGKIGVVSADSVVPLTGYTATSGQAYRAGREARGVQGVRYVVNEIRPRVGGSI
jgi:hypothetical protein